MPDTQVKFGADTGNLNVSMAQMSASVKAALDKMTQALEQFSSHSKQASDAVMQSNKRAEESFNALKGITDGLGSAFSKFKTTMAAALSVAVLEKFVRTTAEVGMRVETLNVAMEQVGTRAGYSTETLNYYFERIKSAGITSAEALTGVNKAIVASLPLDKMRDLAVMARNIGVIAGKNTSETFAGLMHGIESQQVEIFRTLGVNVGLQDQIFAKYAQGLGKTAQQLNSVERAHAYLNAVLEQGAKYTNVAAAADETVGKQLASMDRYIKEVQEDLYGLFGPALTATIKDVNSSLQVLDTWFKSGQVDIAGFGKRAAEAMASFRAAVGTVWNALANDLWPIIKEAAIFLSDSFVRSVKEAIDIFGGWDNVIKGIQTTWQGFILGLKNGLEIVKAVFRSIYDVSFAVKNALSALWQGESDLAKQFMTQAMDNVEREWRRAMSNIEKNTQDGWNRIKAIWVEGAQSLPMPTPPPPAGQPGPDPRAEKAKGEDQAAIQKAMAGAFTMPDKSKFDAAKAEEKAEVAHQQAMWDILKAGIEKRRTLAEISDEEALRQETDMLDRRYEAEMAALQKRLATMKQDPAKLADTYASMRSLTDKYWKDKQELETKAMIAAKQRTDKLANMELTESLAHEQTMYDMRKNALDASAQLGMMTDKQLLEAEKAMLDERYNNQLADLQRRLELMRQDPQADPVQMQEIYSKMRGLTNKYWADTQKLESQALIKQAQTWKSTFDQISSAFGTAIKGILSGTQTLMGGLRSILDAILSAFLDMIAKWVAQWVWAHTFAKLFNSATGVAEVATNAAVGASAAGASVAAIPYVGWAMVPEVMASTYAAIMAMAPAAAAEDGWWEVPGAPITQLHPREMVLPAKEAQGLRDLVGGSGTNVGAPMHAHIYALDSKSFDQYLKRNPNSLSKAFARARRDFSGRH